MFHIIRDCTTNVELFQAFKETEVGKEKLRADVNEVLHIHTDLLKYAFRTVTLHN